MSRHAPLVKELADRLHAMDVKSVVYFHTDHFEPWRPIGAGPAVGANIVEGIYDFCRVTESIDFARRLTLFYKPHLNYALRRGGELVRADPDDLVGFLPRGDHEERIGREAMREVVTSSAHDVQLHIHHENYTATTAHTDPEAIAWFASPLGQSLDEKRLELAIRLNREIIARETGRTSTRWFFVHGHWALNASDDSSCTITNEIDLLLRNGCRGDFTFPAGRQHTNPSLKMPYLCKPLGMRKGYDHPDAEPEVACGNAAAANRKFFIWASPASSVQCSLDYMSESSRRQLENTEKAARDLIENAYVAEGRLYIKTHAHSQHPFYFEHARMPVFPHQHPAVQTLLSVIFDAATQAGHDIEFATAPEVYDQLLTAKSKPEVDLVATHPHHSRGGLGKGFVAAIWPGRKPKEPVSARPRRGLSSARAVEVVRETSAKVLHERIDALGILGSGAYQHYAKMLERGFDLTSAESVLGIIQSKALAFDFYHEIGSGLGTVPFLLALNGYAAMGIECDRRRHDTAEAIWQEICREESVDQTSCRLICARFPSLPRHFDPAVSMAILTDFTSTQSADRLEAILQALRRYPCVLVDLRRFCVVRNTTEEQDALLGTFSTNGFEVVDHTIKEADSAFALLRNKELEVQDGRASMWRRLLPRRSSSAGGGAK